MRSACAAAFGAVVGRGVGETPEANESRMPRPEGCERTHRPSSRRTRATPPPPATVFAEMRKKVKNQGIKNLIFAKVFDFLHMQGKKSQKKKKKAAEGRFSEKVKTPFQKKLKKNICCLVTSYLY